jgi:hypothetical protein
VADHIVSDVQSQSYKREAPLGFTALYLRLTLAEVLPMPASMIVLIAMTTVVGIIAVYRWIVAHKEDDFLHLDDRAGEVIANQRSITRSLNQVDRIGIGLTIATGLYGLALVVIFLYKGLH